MSYTEQELKALVSKVISQVQSGNGGEGEIPVGISNRHIHHDYVTLGVTVLRHYSVIKARIDKSFPIFAYYFYYNITF